MPPAVSRTPSLTLVDEGRGTGCGVSVALPIGKGWYGRHSARGRKRSNESVGCHALYGL